MQSIERKINLKNQYMKVYQINIFMQIANTYLDVRFISCDITYNAFFKSWYFNLSWYINTRI